MSAADTGGATSPERTDPAGPTTRHAHKQDCLDAFERAGRRESRSASGSIRRRVHPGDGQVLPYDRRSTRPVGAGGWSHPPRCASISSAAVSGCRAQPPARWRHPGRERRALVRLSRWSDRSHPAAGRLVEWSGTRPRRRRRIGQVDRSERSMPALARHVSGRCGGHQVGRAHLGRAVPGAMARVEAPRPRPGVGRITAAASVCRAAARCRVPRPASRHAAAVRGGAAQTRRSRSRQRLDSARAQFASGPCRRRSSRSSSASGVRRKLGSGERLAKTLTDDSWVILVTAGIMRLYVAMDGYEPTLAYGSAGSLFGTHAIAPSRVVPRGSSGGHPQRRRPAERAPRRGPGESNAAFARALSEDVQLHLREVVRSFVAHAAGNLRQRLAREITLLSDLEATRARVGHGATARRRRREHPRVDRPKHR